MKRVAIIVLLLCGCAQGATFGNTSETTNSYFGIEDDLCGGVFAPSSDGTLDTIYAFIEKAAGTATGKALLLLESDSSTVATGTEITFSHSLYAWVAFPISAEITNGTNYVLSVCADPVSPYSRLRRNTTGGTTWESAITYPTVPDPLTPISITSYITCIYGHYTESGGDGGGKVAVTR